MVQQNVSIILDLLFFMYVTLNNNKFMLLLLNIYRKVQQY